MSQPEATKLSETLSDLTMAEKRAKKLLAGGTLDVKHELVNNVYPLLRKICEAAAPQEAVEELGEELDELLEQEGSTIQPELGGLIVGFVTAAGELVDAVRGLELDDVTRKKLEGICGRIEEMTPYVLNEVQAATITVDDEEGGGEGTADEDDEDDGANDNEPAEKPENA
jgi:hypothetical protein